MTGGVVVVGLEDRWDSGEFRADVPPQLVGNVLRDVSLGALYRWFREADAEPSGRLEQELQQPWSCCWAA
ncbi:hypothetical protein ABZ733_21605 [Streptomyces longwoodensis]|uniref:hypothetical protein n=1 Tax=Streptomyces longwoodensis TaxID=68231 RepID=UPI0033C5A956